MSKSGRIHQTEKARLLTVSCPNNSMYKRNLVLKKRLLSLSSSRIYGLKKLSPTPNLASVSQFTKFRGASCHCVAPCPCFASCNCCHDPFIVRSAQTCPPFTGFTQLAHPSRCSRSALTTVCFCAHASLQVSVFTSGSQFVYIGVATLHPIHHRLRQPSSCSGVWDPWSVEYQSCKLAMLL